MDLDPKQIQQAIVDTLGKNLKKVFMIALGALLLVRLLMFLNEQTLRPSVQVGPKPYDLKPVITEESESYAQVQALLTEWPEFDDTEYFVLARFNMFDPAVALDAPQLERRATEKYQQSVEAQNRGDLDESLRLVNEALEILPSFRKAQQQRLIVEYLIQQREQQAQQPGQQPGQPGGGG